MARGGTSGLAPSAHSAFAVRSPAIPAVRRRPAIPGEDQSPSLTSSTTLSRLTLGGTVFGAGRWNVGDDPHIFLFWETAST